MTALREAAIKALEAMDYLHRTGDTQVFDLCHRETTEALRAALVEDAMQKFTDVNQELEAALGCDHCNQPLYAAIKCRVCGRVTEPVQEPVQEPVAWIHTDPDKRRVKFLEWRENEPGYRGDWIKTPLYAAPPQSTPLTEEKILSLFRTSGSPTAFARAIEAKHGIT